MQSGDDNSNEEEEVGQGQDQEDETEAEKERKRLSPSNVRRYYFYKFDLKLLCVTLIYFLPHNQVNTTFLIKGKLFLEREKGRKIQRQSLVKALFNKIKSFRF